jgi:nicotinamidase-related amidase
MRRTMNNVSGSLEDVAQPSRAALVVVDMQRDFVAPTGACAKAGDDMTAISAMTGRLRFLIESARRHELLIVYVRSIYDPVYLAENLVEQFDRRGLKDFCSALSSGSDFADGIGPSGAPNEVVVTKHRFSAFSGTSMDLVLRSNGIKTLVMTGVATDVCVESTARDAFSNNYRVVLAEDCMTGFSAERHQASLSVLLRSFGTVASSSDITAAWQVAGSGTRGWRAADKKQTMLMKFEERVRPEHTALLLIDLQVDFCDDQGAIAQRKEPRQMIRDMLPRAKKLLDQAREVDVMIIHVQSEYGLKVRSVGSPHRYPSTFTKEKAVWTASAADVQDDQGFEVGMTEICLPGSRGIEFIDDFRPVGGEPIVTKHRFSAFRDTDLNLLLRSNGIRTVIVAGQTTNCCVESTAREVAMRDYNLVVAEDCVAVKDMHKHLHVSSLETMSTYFGVVTSSSRIIDCWCGPVR